MSTVEGPVHGAGVAIGIQVAQRKNVPSFTVYVCLIATGSSSMYIR